MRERASDTQSKDPYNASAICEAARHFPRDACSAFRIVRMP
jgi:hypothetical protein